MEGDACRRSKLPRNVTETSTWGLKVLQRSGKSRKALKIKTSCEKRTIINALGYFLDCLVVCILASGLSAWIQLSLHNSGLGPNNTMSESTPLFPPKGYSTLGLVGGQSLSTNLGITVDDFGRSDFGRRIETKSLVDKIRHSHKREE